MNPKTSRRALLGAMVAAPVVTATPAIAIVAADSEFQSALAANDAAVGRFNALPAMLEVENRAAYERETELMISACLRADKAVPTNWQEFARWVEHISDDGESVIDDDNAARLLAHVRRLAREA